MDPNITYLTSSLTIKLLLTVILPFQLTYNR